MSPGQSIPFRVSTYIFHAFLSYSMHITSPDHLISLYFITLKILLALNVNILIDIMYLQNARKTTLNLQHNRWCMAEIFNLLNAGADLFSLHLLELPNT
jgi:hypothetical protein